MNISEEKWDDLPPLCDDSGESDSDSDSEYAYQAEIGKSSYQETADMKIFAYSRNQVRVIITKTESIEVTQKKIRNAVTVVEKMVTTSVSRCALAKRMVKNVSHAIHWKKEIAVIEPNPIPNVSSLMSNSIKKLRNLENLQNQK